jgi:hypothetical protein
LGKVLVLASSLHAFNNFIDENGLNRNHFRYISNPTDIRGSKGVVLAIGEYWLNKNYNSDFYLHLRTSQQAGLLSIIKGIYND